MIDYNYIPFLRSSLLLGKHWRKDETGKQIVVLFRPIEEVLQQCSLASKEEIDLDEFIAYLEENNVFLFPHNSFPKPVIETKEIERPIFVEYRPRLVHQIIVDYTTRLQKLADALLISKDNINKYDEQRHNSTIVGTEGYIYLDDSYWYVSISGSSVRHWSSIKKQLSFMELVRNGEDGGEFRSKAMPISQEATMIRKIIGLRKRPALSEAQRKERSERLDGRNGGDLWS